MEEIPERIADFCACAFEDLFLRAGGAADSATHTALFGVGAVPVRRSLSRGTRAHMAAIREEFLHPGGDERAGAATLLRVASLTFRRPSGGGFVVTVEADLRALRTGAGWGAAVARFDEWACRALVESRAHFEADARRDALLPMRARVAAVATPMGVVLPAHVPDTARHRLEFSRSFASVAPTFAVSIYHSAEG